MILTGEINLDHWWNDIYRGDNYGALVEWY